MAALKKALKNRHDAVKVKKKDQQVHVPISQQAAVLVLGGDKDSQVYLGLQLGPARSCSRPLCPVLRELGAIERGRSGTVVRGRVEMGGCPTGSGSGRDMRCQAAKGKCQCLGRARTGRAPG